MSETIQPGATIGVLGSGQLGRMFAIAARRMGYRVHVLSPDDDTPTGQVADVEHRSPYDDLDAVAQFAADVDVVTFEFENVPAETIQVVEHYVPVRPSCRVLHTTQQRVREKTFLQGAGLPVTPFQPIGSLPELHAAATATGFPAVLKTAAWGYDGRGQVLIDGPAELSAAWESLGGAEAVLEQYVDFVHELSVIAARGARGEIATFGPIVNVHRDHILDVSIAPSELPLALKLEAVEIARTVVSELDVVGVLCVEFFLDRDGRLVVNELAPRPHNSGHLTVDACVTCQFEQQVRAVCGLSLGSPRQLRPAAMVNLLGDIWECGEPAWEEALSLPDVKLHLYGKRSPRPGRKMGHLTALADTPQGAAQRAGDARQLLTAAALRGASTGSKQT